MFNVQIRLGKSGHTVNLTQFLHRTSYSGPSYNEPSYTDLFYSKPSYTEPSIKEQKTLQQSRVYLITNSSIKHGAPQLHHISD